jgi:uncharacterized phage-associated protein
MTPYPSKAVANFFLRLGWDSESPIDPMKLQKLVYIAHGWHLALAKTPLVEERIQAWEYGPVIPALYREFKMFGAEPIDWEAGEPGHRPNIASYDIETKRFLERIWELYGDYSGIQLSKMTHQADSPWDKVRVTNGGSLPRRVQIPDDVIQDHYQGLARDLP